MANEKCRCRTGIAGFEPFTTTQEHMETLLTTPGRDHKRLGELTALDEKFAQWNFPLRVAV